MLHVSKKGTNNVKLIKKTFLTTTFQYPKLFCLQCAFDIETLRFGTFQVYLKVSYCAIICQDIEGNIL